MQKLIEAQERGVQVSLFVDDLCQKIDKSQKSELVALGGNF